jgi:hypothetical protein
MKVEWAYAHPPAPHAAAALGIEPESNSMGMHRLVCMTAHVPSGHRFINQPVD